MIETNNILRPLNESPVKPNDFSCHIRKSIFLLLFSIFSLQQVSSQNLHFSQFFNSPLLTNPANTGFIPDGDYRVGINYRNQWSSVMALPYKTMSAFGDVQVMKNRYETGWVGLGTVILKDVAGSGNLASTKAYGSVAYHQMIESGSLLSLGFNVGFANKSINVSGLKFPDQFDGKFFDNKLPTSVFLAKNNITYFDMQVGMNYAYFPTDNIYLNTGFSAHHVNKPKETFFNSTSGFNNTVPVRYTGFMNGSFKLNDSWIVNPNAYVSIQAKSYEVVAGMNAHYNLTGDGENILIGGLYYRHKDAIIPSVGFTKKDITFNFTYDATISTLSNYNNSRGAFEISIIKQGIIQPFSGQVKQTICPSFK
jgi:type IX secretion system PorP/SprF family membrane protein